MKRIIEEILSAALVSALLLFVVALFFGVFI